MNSEGITEITRIIKEKYKIDVFNISDYDLVKFCLNVGKFVKSNHKFILISDNKEHLNAINKGTKWDYILFYKEDYLTFSKNNFVDVLNLSLKRIIEKEADYDICVVCLENIEKCVINLRCAKCGVLICGSCCVDILKKHKECIICKNELIN